MCIRDRVTAVCATIITCTLLGVVIEKIAYTPLRNAPRISPVSYTHLDVYKRQMST